MKMNDFKLTQYKFIFTRGERHSRTRYYCYIDAYIPSAVDENAFFTLAKSCTTEHQIPFAHTLAAFLFCLALSLSDFNWRGKKKLFTIASEAAAVCI